MVQRSQAVLIGSIRIGAVLQKELHDFERLVLLLRQPEERRGLPGRLGQAWFGAEDFAQPVDIANWGEVPDVAAVAPQQIDHARELIVRGEIERRVAVVQLVGIDFHAALDQQRGDIQRIMRRGDVQGALLLRILHFDRRAEIQEKCRHIGAILACGGEDGSGRLHVVGVLREDALRFGAIERETRGNPTVLVAEFDVPPLTQLFDWSGDALTLGE